MAAALNDDSAVAIYTVSEVLSKTVDEAGPLSYILIW